MKLAWVLMALGFLLLWITIVLKPAAPFGLLMYTVVFFLSGSGVIRAERLRPRSDIRKTRDN